MHQLGHPLLVREAPHIDEITVILVAGLIFVHRNGIGQPLDHLFRIPVLDHLALQKTAGREIKIDLTVIGAEQAVEIGFDGDQP